MNGWFVADFLIIAVCTISIFGLIRTLLILPESVMSKLERVIYWSLAIMGLLIVLGALVSKFHG